MLTARRRLAAICLSVTAQLTVHALDISTAQFHVDGDFSTLFPYFHEGWGLKDELGQPRQYTSVARCGATVKLYVRNTSAAPVGLTALRVNGIDLKAQLEPRHTDRRDLKAANFLLNTPDITPQSVREQLEACGSPVWWQLRPDPVLPGRYAELTVRLRTRPSVDPLELELQDDKGSVSTHTLPVAAQSDLGIAAVRSSQEMERLLVYVRSCDGAEFAVTAAALDGQSLPLPQTVVQSSSGFVPLELPLVQPLAPGSFHHIRVSTQESHTAATVFRASPPFFALGMWGYRNDGSTLEEMVTDCVRTFGEHLFNTHMAMAGSHTGFLNSTRGLQLLSEHGLRLMATGPNADTLASPQLYARFLHDEPDCTDYQLVQKLPWHSCVGSFAQALVERQREWTNADPRSLILLNVDMTFKPDNWLTYGQLPDIFALDPYYQNRLRAAYHGHPRLVRMFSQPYCVFAVSEIARSACEPRPLHIILNSTSYRKGDETFRFGTPEEKRIEFYYALAAGATGISYWWFTPYGTYTGCGKIEAEAHAMLQETARLNAEARALAPLLSRACRGTAPMGAHAVSTNPNWLFARTLYVGTQSAVIVLINRDHASDRLGTVSAPIPKATVDLELPAWLAPKAVFRFNANGVTPLEPAVEKQRLRVTLTDIALTDVLVVTSDPSLQAGVRRDWEALQPGLAKVTSRTYEDYAAQRKAAAEERQRAVEQRRETLFAAYANCAAQRASARDRVGTYGYETDEIWNPLGAKYNAQTWWVGRGEVKPDMVKGLRWSPPKPGRYRVAISYLPKQTYRLRVTGPDGKVLTERKLEGQFPAHAAVDEWTVDIPENAVVEFLELGKDADGEMWGRVSPEAYFVPAEQ